ncbi:MAG: glycosyltransferase [Opitutales bacterium]|nr:glycosyltransferase [Opitutales bacterium]
MKLLILQDQLRVGGTERQSLFLARFFLDRGHDARLLVFSPGGELADEPAGMGIPVDFLQKRTRGLPLWAPGLMRAVAGSGADVILCMGRTANCYAGFVQRHFPDKAVIGTLRTGKTLFPLHHWSMGVVRGVLANSNWWARRMRDRGVPAERVHVVHNSVLLQRPESEAEQARAAARERHGVPAEACLFLNVATFRRGKRHMDLLRVMGDLRDADPRLAWRLWLVGDGPERRRCQRWAAENGLGSRVRFFGFSADPLPFYSAADVAVSTSLEDSLPNFLIEAQTMGLPVVAFDCRGAVECCDPGTSGFILPPGELTAFRDECLRLAREPAVRRRAGAAAVPFARRRFAPLPQAEAIERFLLCHAAAVCGNTPGHPLS